MDYFASVHETLDLDPNQPATHYQIWIKHLTFFLDLYSIYPCSEKLDSYEMHHTCAFIHYIP
jgi:hypothetical protein